MGVGETTGITPGASVDYVPGSAGKGSPSSVPVENKPVGYSGDSGNVEAPKKAEGTAKEGKNAFLVKVAAGEAKYEKWSEAFVAANGREPTKEEVGAAKAAAEKKGELFFTPDEVMQAESYDKLRQGAPEYQKYLKDASEGKISPEQQDKDLKAAIAWMNSDQTGKPPIG